MSVIPYLTNIATLISYIDDSTRCGTSEYLEDTSYFPQNVNDNLFVTECQDDLLTAESGEKSKKKSMRSMSRSTFDSVIDDFIEDDFEKASAFGVSLMVVSIVATFLILFGLALTISFSYQTGSQSMKIAYKLCIQFPDWQFLRNSSSSWCDDRIFNLPFQLAKQCPCFATQLRPQVVKPLWPYTGIYGTALGKH